MHCRDFNEKHVAFVDDILAGIELVEMQNHIRECPECAQHDAKIRRSLMLVRNLPTIQPSHDFAFRLERKLAEALLTPMEYGVIRKRVAAAAAIAAVAMIGYIATTLSRVERTHDMLLPPVIASVPESEMAPFSSPPPAIIASAPAGLAIWPVAVFAEQAPVHFAHARFASAGVSR